MDLAKKVKEGVQAVGMVGFTFNTIGVRWVLCDISFLKSAHLTALSDGITMGTSGMRYS